MSKPEPPPDALLKALDEEIVGIEVVGGGEVNVAARFETPTRKVLCKWRPGAPLDAFLTEAADLERLRGASPLRVPQVVAVGTSYLALEWLEPTTPGPEFGQDLARGLAQLHRNQAPQFGLERDNYLGSQPQKNTWDTDWPTFYRENRLLPQLERALEGGLLPERRARLLEEIIHRLPELLCDMDEPPALLHGDLWAGNLVCMGASEPTLIDPAIYFGPREMEIAYIELFSGFPPGLVEHYDAAYPLSPDYPRRRPVHQLWPLLIHLNHFGERYGPPLDDACELALSA
jgi:fructosamine-3-kinase